MHLMKTVVTQRPNNPLRYDPSLDGIRAFAVLGVILYHSYENIFPGGWAGVDIFFVLSGYLITRLLVDEVANYGQVSLRRFYIRRFLRLVPAFSFLLLFALVWALFSHNDRTGKLEAVLMSGLYLMNWSRAFDWFPQFVLGHTWSLAVEEQFYLIWPSVLIALLHSRRALHYTVIGVLAITVWRSYLVLHGASEERTYNGFDTHADVLLIGCALAFTPLNHSFRLLAGRLVVIPISALIWVILSVHLKSQQSQLFAISLNGSIAAWIIVAASQPGPLRRFLSVGIFAFTGRISYGWYLWHYPVFLIGIQFIKPPLGGALALLAYAVAVLSYFFIEMPFLRMKHRLVRISKNSDSHFFTPASSQKESDYQ